MRLLFFKHALAWPRASGHDVHAFHMMQACARLGAAVTLATTHAPTPEALEGLPLAEHILLGGNGAPLEDQTGGGVTTPSSAGSNGTGASAPPRLSFLQEKFRSFYGVPVERIQGVAAAAARTNADAVVAVGLDALPYLAGGLGGRVRVWYAADEWVWHHLSLVRVGDGDAIAHLKSAALKGLYERAYAPLIDRAWVVSATEQRAMRWLAGVSDVDILPNGVDGEFFAPGTREAAPRSAVFWGRLDFEPNIQGLQWFCAQVWPQVRQQVPDATLTVIGFHPGDVVKQLVTAPGIRLLENVPDIREAVGAGAVAVLPFISGGGIKNKLLEAAAMGKAIISTPRALGGLKGEPPLVQARTAEDWTHALTRLWADDERRRALGTAARTWVLTHHTWTAAARDALSGIDASRAKGTRS